MLPQKPLAFFEQYSASTLSSAAEPESITPNTRKRQRQDYRELNDFGLEGSPTRTRSPANPTKRLCPNALLSSSLLSKPSQPSQSSSKAETIVVDDSRPLTPSLASQLSQPAKNNRKKSGIKKNKWWWQYYDIKLLDKTFHKGKKGSQTEEVWNEHYICNVKPGCSFNRYANQLHSAGSVLKDHITLNHKINEDTNPVAARAQDLTAMQTWLSNAEDDPVSFEEALLDWIIFTNQPFTVTESKFFTRMIKASGSSVKVSKGDAIHNKLEAHVHIVEAETSDNLRDTATTVALTLDGWTSQNSLSMLAINVKWLSPDFEALQCTIEFIEIQGSHSGENLAVIVENTLKRHGILQKLLTITGDNASNNDTLCCHLHTSLKHKYDDHLSEYPSHKGTV
jgi:hypothetical protein